ncbi:MAG: hypothetical protein FK731_11205 [Asgard group archaeon]|nr:hypothetical protein [Asgard group archaeon]
MFLSIFKEYFIFISLMFFVVIIIALFIFDIMAKKFGIRKIKTKLGKKQDIQKQLKKLEKKNPKIYKIIENSIDLANQDGTRDSYLALLYSDFLTELSIEDENPIFKENIKRVVYSIGLGVFVIESLDLETFATNEVYFDLLSKVLNGFKIILKEQKFDDNELELFTEGFDKIEKSIIDMEVIISKIREVKQDKALAKKLDSQTVILQKLVEKEPISKTQIKEIKSPSGLKKDQTLSTISAIDDGIIEIRTRAGNYYVSRKYFDHAILQDRRMFELLTDKELEIKIEVLNSTLKMLEQEKDRLKEKEYEEIRSKYLSELFASKQLLVKRKGKIKHIICPKCKSKNSSIQRKCKKCGSDLPYCIVCLNTLGKGDEISICPHCSNVAHANHFKDWLKKTATCPLCKKKIKKELVVTILESMAKIKT